MPDANPSVVSPFALRAADNLFYEVMLLVRAGKLDARCRAADEALEYAQLRMGSSDPIKDLETLVAQ